VQPDRHRRIAESEQQSRHTYGHISYAARLDYLEAETVELRRLKSDLTTTVSIIRGFTNTDCNSLFNVVDRESIYTRGNYLRLYNGAL